MGDGDFWRAVCDRLPAGWQKVSVSWPGLGDQPHEPSVQGFEDLVDLVVAMLARPSDLVAQSLGAGVAACVACRHPQKVRRLVLCATSVGVRALARYGSDWRLEYRRSYPGAARWVTDAQPDLTDTFKRIRAPTLLLAGDSDPISPASVADHLADLLPNARARVIAGAGHSFAVEQPDRVACEVATHLQVP